MPQAEYIAIQPSRTAPANSITIKCKNNQGLDELIEQSRNKQRLLDELAYTITVVESHPALVEDYQIMVDLDGRVYHIDLDRALKKTRGKSLKDVKEITMCVEHAMSSIRKSMNES